MNHMKLILKVVHQNLMSERYVITMSIIMHFLLSVFSSDGAQEVQNYVRSFVHRSSVVIVRFMCYKGFKGCCKRQEQSRGAKKGPVGSIRFK